MLLRILLQSRDVIIIGTVKHKRLIPFSKLSNSLVFRRENIERTVGKEMADDQITRISTGIYLPEEEVARGALVIKSKDQLLHEMMQMMQRLAAREKC